MNWNLPLVAGAVLAVFGLASCGTSPGGPAGGTVIKNPTVEEMERIEAGMGLQPKAKPAPAPSPGVYVPDNTPAASPPTVPLETVQPAILKPGI